MAGERQVRVAAPGSGAVADLWAAAGVMTVTLVVCATIRFTAQTVTDGISWFGVQRATLGPYAVGIIATCLLMHRAGRRLPVHGRLRDATGPLAALAVTVLLLRWSAVLLLAVLATPYTAGSVLNWTHMTVGAGLFALQLGYAVWLLSEHRGSSTAVLVLAQFGAGVVALLSLPDVLHSLLYGQIAFQLAFAAQLPVAVRRLLDEASAAPAAVTTPAPPPGRSSPAPSGP